MVIVGSGWEGVYFFEDFLVVGVLGYCLLELDFIGSSVVNDEFMVVVFFWCEW